MRRGDVEIAREAFQISHMESQDQMLMHSATHVSLAMTYPGEPLKRAKELYLGIMAPWGSFRRKRSLKKKEERN